ncbi:HAD-IC family P-type ATPase [Bacillus sp. JJ1127]|uniref:cation-translocating P-type ATPase n=1 Tax=Bacillus sp. JJ1127 TaxID=3122952 RepID=UPI002FFD64C1
MSIISLKNRFIRAFPGRVRIELYGLKHNNEMKSLFMCKFQEVKGIEKIHASIETGRVLICYNVNIVSSHDIYQIIQSIESDFLKDVNNEKSEEDNIIDDKPISSFLVIPKKVDRSFEKESIPLPLAFSLLGLGVLGVKQMLMGRSTLAKNTGLFYLSGLVSVCTGYPFLKRGLKQMSINKKMNSDLILGMSTFALAFARENLVVLAGLSLLHFVNWKRNQANIDSQNGPQLSSEIQLYSHKQSKRGMILGAATLALTRNPLQGMSVLLGANPRPAITATEYAWNQAELVSRDKKYTIPHNGSLPQLSRTKTILFDDTSNLFREKLEAVQCISHDTEESQIWSVVAPLMKKSNHHLKDEVIEKVVQTGKTLRTAFSVESNSHGMRGTIQGIEICVGSKRFVEKHSEECNRYYLEAKRVENKGYNVLFVSKNKKCIGFILGSKVEIVPELKKVSDWLSHQEWKVGILNNSLNISHTFLKRHGIDTSWLQNTEEQIVKRVTAIRSIGEDLIYVGGENKRESISRLEIPELSVNKLRNSLQSIEYAQKINKMVNQHFGITKIWNYVGSLFAMFSIFTAPIIALMTNAMSLLFLSRAKRISEKIVLQKMDFFLKHVKENRCDQAIGYDKAAWHSMTTEKMMSMFHVNKEQGLSDNQVMNLRKKFGMNQIQSKQSTSWIVSFLKQFKEFTSLILLGAAGLSMFTGGWFDGLAMGTVLLCNAVIGTMQERKAEKVVEALNEFRPPNCKVIRNQNTFDISSKELVPGDIVCVEAGDRIPADLRIIHSWNLEVNEATLTGESLPIEKVDCILDLKASLAERKNMLFMGTAVTRGKAIGVVAATGMDTEMGAMVSLVQGEEVEVTPLQKKVTSISKMFIKGAVAAGGLVLLAGIIRGLPITQMIATSITLAASAIPEGLPIMITIALSAGISRMSKNKALVRKLSALETLGRTTIICSDKTGTLTKNEMTVKAIATLNQLWTVEGDGYEPNGEIREMSGEVAVTEMNVTEGKVNERNEPNVSVKSLDLERIMQISVLCNNSELKIEQNEWKMKGDPTEGALLCLAAKSTSVEDYRGLWNRCHEIPFDSETSIMSVICQNSTEENEYKMFSKGSVEAILDCCKFYQENGRVHLLNDEQKNRIIQRNTELADGALRVLALAYRSVDWEANKIEEQELIFVGLVGMIDPPKPEVEKSILEAYRLGVKPVMITGDHPNTAISIAKEIGIKNTANKVLNGQDIDRLTDKELEETVKDVSIFARVTPSHKLRIVKVFQKYGQIVVMTGDGVNDTPAIKKANVGIAMGKTGTEVTKEAADIVLKEDHIGSIIDGVKEGRTIIGNIRKAVGCLLTGNLAEILVTSVAVIAGLPIPLIPIQILLMNLITDALPAMILAVNPGNKTKQTKRQDIVDKELYQKVITRGVLLGAGSLGLFVASLTMGMPLAVAQSTAFATLVAGQLIQTFSWRQEGSEETVRDWSKDHFFMTAIGISWLTLFGALYFPPISKIFHTVPLNIKQWILITVVAGSVSKLSKICLKLLTRKTKNIHRQECHEVTVAI